MDCESWNKDPTDKAVRSAARHHAGGFGMGPLYLSSFLSEEGRLAALTGDTAGAVRAYRHYLGLRPIPHHR
jgi:hypothetical protein